MKAHVLHQKFIVVADIDTGKPLEIHFSSKPLGFHYEIFAEAEMKWAEKGKRTICMGGGKFSIIDNYAVFYSKSSKYGRFDNDFVARLAKEHPAFKDKEYTVICKGGYEDPWELIETNKQ